MTFFLLHQQPRTLYKCSPPVAYPSPVPCNLLYPSRHIPSSLLVNRDLTVQSPHPLAGPHVFVTWVGVKVRGGGSGSVNLITLAIHLPQRWVRPLHSLGSSPPLRRHPLCSRTEGGSLVPTHVTFPPFCLYVSGRASTEGIGQGFHMSQMGGLRMGGGEGKPLFNKMFTQMSTTSFVCSFDVFFATVIFPPLAFATGNRCLMSRFEAAVDSTAVDMHPIRALSLMRHFIFSHTVHLTESIHSRILASGAIKSRGLGVCHRYVC